MDLRDTLWYFEVPCNRQNNNFTFSGTCCIEFQLPRSELLKSNQLLASHMIQEAISGGTLQFFSTVAG
jgi:hypothetical protein